MFVLPIFVVCIVLSASDASEYVFSNEKVSFFQGYIRCKQHDMDPAEILSDQEEEAIENKIGMLKASDDSPSYWIFATSMGNSENFFWLKSGKSLLYSNFANDVLNNANNSELCVEIFKTSPPGVGYKWNTAPCELKKRFICQTSSGNGQVFYG